MSDSRRISITVEHADALTVPADVLVLKYAQTSYGVDRKAAEALGIDLAGILPPNGFRLFAGGDHVAAEHVLFLGVRKLRSFRYRGIREFASKALTALAGELPQATSVLMTLHGPGYGLDERECIMSETAGLIDAIVSGDLPSQLRTITIVEQNAARYERLRRFVSEYFPNGTIDSDAHTLGEGLGLEKRDTLRAAGYDSDEKEFIFVAMPFADDTSDLFHYGISSAVTQCDFLCERIDLVPNVGDVLQSIKERIASAAFVVAELSERNPNVFLEVGYAWGCNVPTILLVRKDIVDKLPFDVQGQHCVTYASIRELEEKLRSQLIALAAKSSPVENAQA